MNDIRRRIGRLDKLLGLEEEPNGETPFFIMGNRPLCKGEELDSRIHDNAITFTLKFDNANDDKRTQEEAEQEVKS
jgi:hypothetical protein